MAERTLTRAIINAYAELTTDRNPLHVDDAFAEASQFEGVIAHGFLLLGGPLTVLAESFEHPLTLECRFQRPGRPNDTLHTEVLPSDGEGLSFDVRAGAHALVGGVLRGGHGPSSRGPT